MLGRSRLPVLAEISGPSEEVGPWSMTREDIGALDQVLLRLEDKRCVLVGGGGGEAATVAIAVATAAVASGRRTVLVECDLARPRLAAQIGVAATAGLHEYLRWEAGPADLLRPVVLAGQAAAGAADPLVCICGGRPADNAEALLCLRSFAHTIEKLRAGYEIVLLVAAPPATEPTSCLAASRQADAALAALPAAATRGRAGRPARAALRRLPIPVLGTIAVGSS